MLPVLLELLVLLLTVLVLVVVVVWLTVAFAGPRTRATQERARRFWQPPLANGRALFDWARQRAATLTGLRLKRSDAPSAARKLVTELQEGMMEAMLPSLSLHDRTRTMPCPKDGQGLIGVTPPEAIALADYIRENLPRAEAKRIHDLAVQNAKKIVEQGSAVESVGNTPCALLNCHSVCRTYPIRPLQCRPIHARMIGREVGLDIVSDDDRNPPSESYIEAIEDGVEAGLIDELENKGLDGNSYELNAALAIALDHPDAGQRWLAGEDLFAGCKSC